MFTINIDIPQLTFKKKEKEKTFFHKTTYFIIKGKYIATALVKHTDYSFQETKSKSQD